jgi:hypothetical protein
MKRFHVNLFFAKRHPCICRPSRAALLPALQPQGFRHLRGKKSKKKMEHRCIRSLDKNHD